MKAEKLPPELAFDAFYEAIWAGRWPALKASLLCEKESAAFAQGLMQPYYMDRASVITASLLPLSKGDRILDMCAAPGGKTLVLAARLEEGSTIVANDRSRDRKIRLDKVLDQHLDPELRARVTTANRDASRWGLYEKEAYDAVLLDAPCSSERHVLQSAKHLAQWSANRPKRLAIEQYCLLSSAFMTLKHGGFILYSTCSINPGENEEVIARLFKKHGGEVEHEECTVPASEKRSFGAMILPDRADGLGPMYFCLLRKL